MVTLRLVVLMILAALPVKAVAAVAYVLGPLDQIEVNIASYAELRTVTRIGPDGMISLPLIGSVRAGGLTPVEAARGIEARYAAGGFIKSPSVRIEIAEYQSRKASVLGQVNAQGLIALDRPYSVAEIIARAGGLGPEAADSATIVRPTATGTERIVVDLSQMGGNGSGGAGALTEIRAGDVVVVPRAPTFSVVGAVNKAGVYRLMPGMTVQQALASAGDIARIGTRAKLRIRRIPAGGGATILIEARADEPVLPGDVLIVRERLF